MEILFGGPDAEVSMGPVPLEPAFGSPGEYLATVTPTRPGQYTFHITGTIDGDEVDEFFTSGPETFSPVGDAAEVEFPVQDPPRGELAEGIRGLRSDLGGLQSSAQAAEDAAGTARVLAILGIVLGVIGLAVAVAALRRRPAAR